MKIVYKDLLKFFNQEPSIEDLSNKLFQLGHEHEFNDGIFDMELTPNRGDCLSLVGLARDLSVFYEFNLDIDFYEGEIDKLNLNFVNLSSSACPKISFLEIEIESTKTVNKYKNYMEDFFNNLDVKKNNFFTDISNYVSYELGQPTHCFDSNKICGPLVFEEKKCNKSFKTLLDTDITLQDKNCIFINNDEIISLAGVMGGKSTACSDSTNKVLIECAFFNPESIIGKSVKYGLKSDAAHKFERGVDINSQERTLRRFLKIVDDHAEIKSFKIISFESDTYKNKELDINLDKINAILGTKISAEEYKTSLEKLGFIFNSSIQIPSYRSDISTQNDLAEEMARIIGYNNINNQSINMPSVIPIKSSKNIIELKNFLKQKGFNEVINFPFTKINKSYSIEIDNPLDSNKKYLRTNLKESLIENLLFNERRQKDSIKFFELSDVYYKKDKLETSLRLGIIASGKIAHDHINFSKKIDEKYLNNIFKGVFNFDFKFKIISRDKLNTKIRDDIFYLEAMIEKDLINMNLITVKTDKEVKFNNYVPISEFPASKRDFSFSITNFLKYDDVIEHIKNINDPLIKESFIFDFYNNKNANEIKLGLRLIFQSNEKTLSDLDIKNISIRLLSPILNLEGVSIPGLEKK